MIAIESLVREVKYDLAGQIIGLAMKVHGTLGAGFLESIYQNALSLELEQSGLAFEREAPLVVRYAGRVVGEFRADLVIQQILVVEIKAVQGLATAHEVQLVNYLTATGMDDGLLLNFGGPKLEFKRKYRLPQRSPA